MLFYFQTNGSYLPHGIAGEYQAKHIEAGFGYQNTAFAHSQPHLAVTKYATTSPPQSKYLKRSASTVSQFVSANRLQDMVQLNASQLTGYQKNEFDTSKFTSGLMLRTHSQYDLPSFGLDPDAPVFVTGPYGRGGLGSNGGGLHTSDYYQRPFSALSGVKAPPSWRPPRQPTENSIQVNSCLILHYFCSMWQFELQN